jgi:hypothetical protein
VTLASVLRHVGLTTSLARLGRVGRRQYDATVRRRLERIVLGWVMAVAAYLLDRRLRRAR